MLYNSKSIFVCVNRLAGHRIGYGNSAKTIEKKLANLKHAHTMVFARHSDNEAAEALLPIPNNIDPSETTRFSPQRTRDISATVIVSQFQHIGSLSKIDITADNSATLKSETSAAQDPHVQSYDCNSAVSLNSVMQSNVPSPFGGMHKFSHLNMPGGQWSQDSKFVAQYQQNSHYMALRYNARSNWTKYDQNAIVQQTSNDMKVHKTTTNFWTFETQRGYSTKIDATEKNNAKIDTNTKSLTKKEQLKKAFKEYGATVVVFHIAISLASLGGFYLLVSGGIDIIPLLESFGLASSALSNKIASNASTFVVAYAIHKIFAPVRITITLGATPFIVRYLRSKGLLKPKIVK